MPCFALVLNVSVDVFNIVANIMAEGGFEYDDFGEGEEIFPEDEAETSFIDDVDTTPTVTPSWALGSEEPVGVNQGDVVDVRRTKRRVQQFQAERSVHSPSVGLDFVAEQNGALWVKWGHSWNLLTKKNSPGVFPVPTTITQYYGVDMGKALGIDVAEPKELSPKAISILQKVEAGLPSNIESITLQELPDTAKEMLNDEEFEQILGTLEKTTYRYERA